MGLVLMPNTVLPGGETVLMTACRTGRVGPVKALLAKGADVNAHEQKGQTALMWAAADGNVDVVDVLLTSGGRLSHAARFGLHTVFLRDSRRTNRSRFSADECRSGCQRMDASRAAELLVEDYLCPKSGHRKRAFSTCRGLIECRGSTRMPQALGLCVLHAINGVPLAPRRRYRFRHRRAPEI